MADFLALTTLGGLGVARSGQPITRWASRKAAAVIATQGTILWEGYADAAGAALWLQCAVTHEATLAYQRDECAALLTRVQAALDEAARERILAEGAQIAPQALLGTLLAGD